MTKEIKKDITEGFFPESEEVKEAPFLRGSDFDGEGQKLEVVNIEVITPEKGPNGENYGVSNNYGPGGVIEKENYFIKNGSLKEGQTFRYNFIQNGVKKHFDNGSVGFAFAMQKAKLGEGDKVTIKRDKESNFKVNWEIVKE